MSEVYIREEAGLHLDRANKLLAGLGNFGGNGSAAFHAVTSALNRAAKSAKSKAGKFASEQYVISQGGFKAHVRDKMFVNGGGTGVSGVRLVFAGSVIKLIEFGTRFTKDGDVAVSVKRGGGGTLSHAFIPENMALGVYERVGSSRLPIEQKYGPSAAHMMMDGTVTQNMEDEIVTVFNDRIEHEINRILNGW